MTSRAEHLSWCKKRALEYVERGENRDALTSMIADLGKHPETQDLATAVGLEMILLRLGGMDSKEGTKKIIEDFN